MTLERRFLGDIRHNPANVALLERLPGLGLPDAWLVAGCLFQTVWNLQDGHACNRGIQDHDLFYFDGTDLTPEAEGLWQQRVDRAFADLGLVIEVKNQARVHTWYAEWFGHPYPALADARDGIRRFLVAGTCVGLQPQADAEPTLYAPYGLDDLYQGVLRPNPLCNHRDLFRGKAASYRARWPRLRVDETLPAPAGP